MQQNTSDRVVNDTLRLRLAALGALMDHLIATLTRSRLRFEEARLAFELVRGVTAKSEPRTAVQRPDLSEMNE